jgi:hypothetical protein
VIVPRRAHDQGAPLRVVHEPGAPAAQPPGAGAPLRGLCAVPPPGRAPPSVAPDLERCGRLVPAELPRGLADPLAFPADHDVLALRDAKMPVGVYGDSKL